MTNPAFWPAGYTPENWRELEAALRRQIREAETELARATQYVDIYKISGSLTGPNGKVLSVVRFWITLTVNGETRFVTLVPDRGKSQ